MQLTEIQDRYARLLGPLPSRLIIQANERQGGVRRTDERGFRATPESQLRALYRLMWVDPDLRARILEIRHMDDVDPRVKKIHRRTAAMVIKGGLRLNNPGENRTLKRTWDRFQRRLQLNQRAKLASDGRGLMMEGNLPMQWALGDDNRVACGIRMPAETIKPLVNEAGRIADVRRAWEQYDILRGKPIAHWALWELTHARIDPANFDDLGSLGRPYLDATRTAWKQLRMTEEDLVIRRRMRAPQRIAHLLENISEPDFETYKNEVEQGQADGVRTDHFIRGKGDIKAIEGDRTLEQIADVAHLLDTFFAGSPAPKGLFGYPGDLSRDILEDLKRDFYEEVDALQDELAMVYQQGLELDLLLQGANPDGFDFQVQYAERSTETLNQRADRALKYSAMGTSMRTVWESAGLDASDELERLKQQKRSRDPYPDPNNIGGGGSGTGGGQDVTITPGNAPKGESATSVSND